MLCEELGKANGACFVWASIATGATPVQVALGVKQQVKWIGRATCLLKRWRRGIIII